jgi:hypothetical protein
MAKHGESDSVDIPSDFPFSDYRAGTKFFGLTEEFTRYYSSDWKNICHVSDGRESGVSTSMNARLKYQTKAPMRLLFLPETVQPTMSTIQHLSSLREIDGWIYREDPGAGWYEVALFRPMELLEEDFTILNRRLVETTLEEYTSDDLSLVAKATFNKSAITLDASIFYKV